MSIWLLHGPTSCPKSAVLTAPPGTSLVQVSQIHQACRFAVWDCRFTC
jgi:hypothetical protein